MKMTLVNSVVTTFRRDSIILARSLPLVNPSSKAYTLFARRISALIIIAVIKTRHPAGEESRGESFEIEKRIRLARESPPACNCVIKGSV